MPIYGFFIARWLPGGHETFGGMFNCLVHVVMYGYYFLAALGHSLIRVVLIQICSAGAKNFINNVFCHPQFSGVIQNIENRCATLTPVCQC